MPDRVQDDVGDMVVGEGVLDLAGPAAGVDDAGGAQHTQVLGDQWLAHAEGGHQLMNGHVTRGQFPDDPEAHRGSEGLEQLAGCLKGGVGSCLRGGLGRSSRCHMRKLANSKRFTLPLVPGPVRRR